jgi:hypothetical protein
MAGFAGHLDTVMQSHISGWAAKNGRPHPVTICVNDKAIGQSTPNVIRPDLPAYGIAAEAGFLFNLPEPLGPNDIVSAVFPDGSQTGNSPSTDHQKRLRQLFDGLDLGTMWGLELGPLDRPLLSNKRANVHYVDRDTWEGLVAEFSAHGHESTCNSQAIARTDVVWRDGASLAECVRRTYDFCLASHVIEHAPNMIDWLNQLTAVLREGGLINLAVPDKTRTFDHRRKPTTPAQLIEWNLSAVKIPTPGQVFENMAYGCDFGSYPPLVLEQGMHAARIAAAGGYVGAHCNVFTESSFLEAFAVLCEAGLLKLKCQRFFQTRDRANEFIVSLRKDSQSPPAALAASYRAQTP